MRREGSKRAGHPWCTAAMTGAAAQVITAARSDGPHRGSARCTEMLLTAVLAVLAALGGGAGEVLDAAYWRAAGREQLRRALSRGGGAETAKNVVLFVGDGMGLATTTAAGILKGGEGQLLTWERFPTVGLAKTYSTDHMVPDSAATATAFLSGVKTRTKVLGLDTRAALGRCDRAVDSAAALTTLASWAQRAGKHTGVVSTARITHATPAALYARTNHRDWECDGEVAEHSAGCVADIARQLVEELPGRELRVVLGGGRRQLGASGGADPDEDDSCTRRDGRDLAREWTTLGGGRRVYVNNTEQLMQPGLVENADYLMGLFSAGHMAYDAERDAGPRGQPSLANMTRQALRLLRRHPRGFVLLVEAGRVDMAHHKNYARLALLEALELDRAVAAALQEVDLQDTLVVVTADHSHAMTINGYPAKGADILGVTVDEDDDESDGVPYETLSYANGPGALLHVNRSLRAFSAEERAAPRYRHSAGIYTGHDETHAGEDVPVYAVGPGAALLAGVYEQNYLATAMAHAARIAQGDGQEEAMDIDTNQLSAAIREPPPSGEYRVTGAAAHSASAALPLLLLPTLAVASRALLGPSNCIILN